MKTYRFSATAFALISICAGASAPMSASAVETFYTIKVEGGPDGNIPCGWRTSIGDCEGAGRR